MKRAFEGLRVIDTTHVLAGPFAAFQLGVLGAEVIKVEDPTDPDQARFQGPDRDMNDTGMGTAFLGQGSGKSCLAVDLKSPEGKDVMRRLLKTADVFIENYRPGAFKALGFGYEDVKAINPGIIYCSMSAFGSTGPRREHRGYDNILQAFSGMMAMTGEDPSKPFKCGAPIIDYAAGTTAAFAIASALLQRERNGGEGTFIDVSMLDVSLMFETAHVTSFFWSGKVPTAKGNSFPFATIGGYEASDGPVMISASNLTQQRRLWTALGREEMIKENNNQRLDDHQREEAVLSALIRTKPGSYWEDLLNSEGVPCARIRSLDETLKDPQVQARPVLHAFDETESLGRGLTTTVAGFRFSEGGPALSSPPQPVGAQTDEILNRLGYDREAVSCMREKAVVR